jgi:hypothetical protein
LLLNQEAQHLLGSEAPFVLYLRPFSSAHRFAVANSIPERVDRLLIGSWWDIELALTFAMDSSEPVVAVGDKYRSFGAAKLLASDAIWQDLAADLMMRASLIVFLPAEQPGTAWEVEKVITTPDLRTKTVFMMPASSTRMRRLFMPWSWFRERRVWERTRSHFSRTGRLELPAFDPAGAFFTIGPDNKSLKVWATGGFSHNFVQHLFCAVIDVVRKTRSPEERETSFRVAELRKGVRIHSCLGSDHPICCSHVALSTVQYSFRLDEVDPARGRLPVRIQAVLRLQPLLLPMERRVIGLPGDEIQMRNGVLYIVDEVRGVVARQLEDDHVSALNGRIFAAEPKRRPGCAESAQG